MFSDKHRNILIDGIEQLALKASSQQVDALVAYIELLRKWNRVHNLTSIDKPLAIVRDHLLDSLAVLPHMKKLSIKRLLDVGSGAGLPGLPIAILQPDFQVCLLDSREKRTQFLQQVKIELNLQNVSVECGRIEHFRPDKLYDGVITRAFSNLANSITMSQHACDQGGYFLAMKGQVPAAELENLNPGISVKAIEVLQVPGLNSQRHLIILQNKCTLGAISKNWNPLR